MNGDTAVLTRGLAFRLDGGAVVEVHGEATSVTREDDGALLECWLLASVSGAVFRDVLDSGAFNLVDEYEADVPADLAGSVPYVHLRLLLRQSLTEGLRDLVGSADDLAHQLVTAAVEEPLRRAGNWFCTSVHLLDAHGGSSFDTFWAATSPSAVRASLPHGRDVSGLVTAWFAERAWVFRSRAGETGTLLFLEPPDDLPGWTCLAYARDVTDQFLFFSDCPVEVPEEARPAVAELVLRLNETLAVGRVDLDWDSGRSRVATGVDVEGGRLDQALVTRVVEPNLAIARRLLPAIVAVTTGRLGPREALTDPPGRQ